MMFAHGLISPAMFMMCGVMQHSVGHRLIPRVGGLAAKMPQASAAIVAAFLASLGLPGMVGFLAEWQVFVGSWQAFGWATFIPLAYLVITAAYLLWALQRAFFGPVKGDAADEHVHDWKPWEAVPVAILLGLTILFGLWPPFLNDVLKPTVGSLLAGVGA